MDNYSIKTHPDGDTSYYSHLTTILIDLIKLMICDLIVGASPYPVLLGLDVEPPKTEI